MAVTQTRRREVPRMAGGLPCGRRVTRGNVRWYLLKVREGSEASTCERLLALVPEDVLADCFPLRRERWFRREGSWRLEVETAYRGYVFAVSPDPVGLAKALSRLTVQTEIAGVDGREWMPLAPEAQAWFERSLDASHVLRNSMAVIEGGALRVTDGPLVGQEPRVGRVDRHRRRCFVDAGGFTELMAIDVPLKS